MMNKFGQKNLFICLNDKVSALPIVQFIESLKVNHPELTFDILVDEKQKASFMGFKSESLIFLSKESFASSSPFSNQILCNVKSIDSQMKDIEKMGFDKVFQIGPIQWGRWMLSHLNQKVIRVPLPNESETSNWLILSALHQFFGLPPELNKTGDQALLIHPYADNEIDWHFLARLKSVSAKKYPWLKIVIHDKHKNEWKSYESPFPVEFYSSKESLAHIPGLLVSFEESIGAVCSLRGRPSGWVTEAGDKKDFTAFYPNSFMVTMNSEEFCPQEFLTALGYWRAGRLGELAFLNIQSQFNISSVQLAGDGLNFSSVSQNFEEYHLIKNILVIYQEVSKNKDQAGSTRVAMDCLMDHRFEKYLFYSAIKSSKYVVEKMIIANRKGERTFKELSNDFYKITIADEILEKLMVDWSPNQEKNILFNKLNKLLIFLQNLEYSGEAVIEKSVEIS